MENIVRDHDLLHEELKKSCIQPVYKLPDFANELSLIDAWETHTLAYVTKIINQEADRARNVVRSIINENRDRMQAVEIAISEKFDQLKKRLAMLSDQLQERMKTSDYLEPDLLQWNTELSDIKRLCITPQASTHRIVNKITVTETKQTKIDISNTLDIKHEDEDRSNIPNHVNQTKEEARLCNSNNSAVGQISGTIAQTEDDDSEDDICKF
jgi:hypothetical protein